MNDFRDTPHPPRADLDPDLRALLPHLNAAAPPVDATTKASDLRESFDALLDLLGANDPPNPFDGSVADGEVSDGAITVPVRTWTPRGWQAGGDTVVVFHGGGWVLGDLDSAAVLARTIAERMHVLTVAVDYRLAPEHPFPAAFDDCLAVTLAVRRQTSGWFAVAGDSAGGNLAAAVALSARDEGIRIDAQLLFYPALDPNMASTSHVDYAEHHLLTGDAMRYYWASYAKGPSPADSRFSPPLAATLSGVAPAVITTAGADPLHDEGRDYAARLVLEGGTVLMLPQPTLIHGWVDQIRRVPAAKAALYDALDALEVLRRRPTREVVS